jgi:SAICAR synthetase
MEPIPPAGTRNESSAARISQDALAADLYVSFDHSLRPLGAFGRRPTRDFYWTFDAGRWTFGRLQMQTSSQSIIDLPGVKKLRSEKVREVFDLGETLLFVATDRLSASDVILPGPIPSQGPVLNQLSAFWGGNRKNFGKISRSFPPPNE